MEPQAVQNNSPGSGRACDANATRGNALWVLWVLCGAVVGAGARGADGGAARAVRGGRLWAGRDENEGVKNRAVAPDGRLGGAAGRRRVWTREFSA